MIDEKTKQKLLEEIQKFGIVFLACQKFGISRATYYRWKNEDEKFNEAATEAERTGRENICDIAKYALVQNIKEKNERAIEYTLSHLSPEFKEKQTTNVVMVHRKEVPLAMQQKTLEDLIDEDEKQLNKVEKIKERFKKIGGIPPKADGSKITDEELPEYEIYIEEYYIKEKKMLRMGRKGDTIIFVDYDKPTESIDTEDSKSETDKQLAKPEENQIPLNNSNLDSATQDKPLDNNI